jgi:hypothetical protein
VGYQRRWRPSSRRDRRRRGRRSRRGSTQGTDRIFFLLVGLFSLVLLLILGAVAFFNG